MAAAPNLTGAPVLPTRRALLVIDVQNEYFDGNLPIEYPDRQTSLANIVAAIHAAHEAGVPVVLVQNFTPPGTPLFAEGSHGAELHPAIAAQPRALLLRKGLPSAFAETGLQAWLTRHAVNTLSVVGYMTHNCVDATVRHAAHAGYEVEVLEDATGSVSYANRAGHATAGTIHRTFMTVMQSRFANVVGTAQWIEALRGTPLPPRESIYSSIHSSSQAARAPDGALA